MEKFTGKVWVMGDDIDTDIILPTEYLVFKTIEEMKPYAFSPLREDIAKELKNGDIIVAGNNFGCGSSREQAPEVVKALGVKCVIAKSFARIFFRNAINNGLLLIENADLADDVKEGDEITVTISPGFTSWPTLWAIIFSIIVCPMISPQVFNHLNHCVFSLLLQVRLHPIFP
ncbi:MAG: 3-isopropylmalate dehydratase [Lachnospiraceae bacterium]|nr:3-isopropylmalate dehydratase [Lachnospiraceae bacterium]